MGVTICARTAAIYPPLEMSSFTFLATDTPGQKLAKRIPEYQRFTTWHLGAWRFDSQILISSWSGTGPQLGGTGTVCVMYLSSYPIKAFTGRRLADSVHNGPSHIMVLRKSLAARQFAKALVWGPSALLRDTARSLCQQKPCILANVDHHQKDQCCWLNLLDRLSKVTFFRPLRPWK